MLWTKTSAIGPHQRGPLSRQISELVVPRWFLRKRKHTGARSHTKTLMLIQCVTGAQGRNRTTDTVIFSHVLYQLSYLGAGPRRQAKAWRAPRVIEARFQPVQDDGCAVVP